MYKRMVGTACLMLALLNGSEAVPLASNGLIEFDGMTINPTTSPSFNFEKFTGDQSADTFFLVQVAPNAVHDAAKTFESMFAQYIPENAYIIRTNFTYARLLAQSPHVTYLNVLPAQSKVTTRVEDVLKRIVRADISTTSQIDTFFAEEIEVINENVRQAPPRGNAKPEAVSLPSATPSFAPILPASQKHRAVVLGARDVDLSSSPSLALHLLEAPADASAVKKRGLDALAADGMAKRTAAVEAALNTAMTAAYEAVLVQAKANPSLAGAVANLSEVDAYVDAKAVASAAVLPLTIAVAPVSTAVKHSATMPAASSLSIHSPLLDTSPSALTKDIVASARDAVLRKATTATAARPSALRNHLDTVAASLASDAASAPLASLSEGQQTIALARSMAGIIDLQRAAIAKAVEDAVASLAALPHVLVVDVQMPTVAHNLHAKYLATVGTDAHIPVGGNDANNLYHAAGIKGAGTVVGVCDSGLDVHSCFFSDLGRPIPYNTVDKAARKVVQYIPYIDNNDTEAGHGTHVAGTIAGNSNGDPTMSRFDGVAPDAKIAIFDAGDSSRSIRTPANLADMFAFAWQAEGHIHSNSWGCGRGVLAPYQWCNAYNSNAYYADKWMHEHDESLILVANGNDGDIGYGTVGAPATAKNVLAVGALTNSAGSFAELHPNLYPWAAYSERTVATFSSLGPTIDNRIKPDILAVGHIIASARASGNETESCAMVGKSGTSMATPTAAGTAVLLKEYLQKGLFASPPTPMSTVHGSLLKAILINSAQPVEYLRTELLALNMPMRKQLTASEPIDAFTHLPLGRLISLKAYAGNTAHLYFTPSAGGSSTRSYRLVVNDGCRAKYTANFGTTTAVSDLARTTQATVDASVKPMDWEGVSTSHSTLYLKFEASTTFEECSFLNIGILEYDSATIATAPGYTEVDCNETIESWPDFDERVNQPANADYLLELGTYRFSCPAAPACTDAHANGAVRGTTRYTTNSAICRAALHIGAVDYINANRVIASGDIDEWVKTHPRSLTTVNAYKVDAPPNMFFDIDGSVFNGVTSANVTVSGGDNFMILTRAGAAQMPAGIDSPYQFANDMQEVPSEPNHISGFGKLTLATAAPLGTPASGAPRKLAILSDGSKVMTHESARVQCFTVGDTPQATTVNSDTAAVAYSPGPDNVKVTLAWNDYAGFPAASKRMLVNDLDLFVYSPDGTEHRGNDRVDKRNTVEQVTLPAKGGVYCAAVRGAYVPLGQAKYSLVVNGRDAATCPPNPVTNGGSLAGKWMRSTGTTPTCTGAAKEADFPAVVSLLQAAGCSIIRPSTTTAGCATDPAANLFGLRLSACDSDTYTVAELGPATTPLDVAWSASGAITIGTAPGCTYQGSWTDGSDTYTACFDTAAKTAKITWATTENDSCTAVYSLDGEPVVEVQNEFIKPAQNLIPIPDGPNGEGRNSAAGTIGMHVFVGVASALAVALAMLW